MTAHHDWQKQILAGLEPVVPVYQQLDNGREDEHLAGERRELRKWQPKVYAALPLTPAQKAADDRWAEQHLTPAIMDRHREHLAKIAACSKVEGVEKDDPAFAIGTRSTHERTSEPSSAAK